MQNCNLCITKCGCGICMFPPESRNTSIFIYTFIPAFLFHIVMNSNQAHKNCMGLESTKSNNKIVTQTFHLCVWGGGLPTLLTKRDTMILISDSTSLLLPPDSAIDYSLHFGFHEKKITSDNITFPFICRRGQTTGAEGKRGPGSG